jgi:holo-[acyl-carrier protein] synthase
MKATGQSKVSCGIDIVTISRIEAASRNPRFLKRVFTETELEYSLKKKAPHRHLAGRFAAKEACLKALTTGLSRGASWKDIEVVNSGDGSPVLNLRSAAKKYLSGRKVFVSIAYTKDLAVASVVVE